VRKISYGESKSSMEPIDPTMGEARLAFLAIKYVVDENQSNIIF
jgi:hypothetical protein